MNKDRAASLIFLATGIYGLIFSRDLSMGAWNQPGARVFPLCISILLCLSGILGFIRAKGKGVDGEKEAGIDWHAIGKNLVRPLQILGITLAFILIMEHMGYLLTSWLYLFVLLFWVSQYRFWVATVIAALVGTGSWYFFGRVLAVQLPMGVLPF